MDVEVWCRLGRLWLSILTVSWCWLAAPASTRPGIWSVESKSYWVRPLGPGELMISCSGVASARDLPEVVANWVGISWGQLLALSPGTPRPLTDSDSDPTKQIPILPALAGLAQEGSWHELAALLSHTLGGWLPGSQEPSFLSIPIGGRCVSPHYRVDTFPHGWQKIRPHYHGRLCYSQDAQLWGPRQAHAWSPANQLGRPCESGRARDLWTKIPPPQSVPPPSDDGRAPRAKHQRTEVTVAASGTGEWANLHHPVYEYVLNPRSCTPARSASLNPPVAGGCGETHASRSPTPAGEAEARVAIQVRHIRSWSRIPSGVLASVLQQQTLGCNPERLGRSSALCPRLHSSQVAVLSWPGRNEAQVVEWCENGASTAPHPGVNMQFWWLPGKRWAFRTWGWTCSVGERAGAMQCVNGIQLAAPPFSWWRLATRRRPREGIRPLHCGCVAG